MKPTQTKQTATVRQKAPEHELLHRCERAEAARDQWEIMYNDELTWYNDAKAHAGKLAEALRDILFVARGAAEESNRAKIEKFANAALAAYEEAK